MQIIFPEKEDNVEYAFKLAKSHDLVTTKASKSGLKKITGWGHCGFVHHI